MKYIMSIWIADKAYYNINRVMEQKLNILTISVSLLPDSCLPVLENRKMLNWLTLFKHI